MARPMRVLVVGAGISGLSLAHYLQRTMGPAVNVVLAEKGKSIGGWVQSRFLKGKKGIYFFEQGPRSLMARSTAVCALSLIHELGLRAHIVKANPAARVRFVLKDGKFEKVPSGPISALMSPLTKPVIAGAFKNLWSGRDAADSIRPDAEAGALTEADDLSIGQFFSTRINAHTAESLLDPLVAGIWSGDVNRLSIWSCFPALPSAEARSSNHSFVRGLISAPRRPSGAAEATPPKGLHQPPIDDVVARRAMTDGLVGSSFSFRHGLQMLPEALYASLQRYENVKIRLNASVSDLSASTGAVQARIGDKVESFDKVFWTSHASALRQSLGAVVTPTLANDLSAFEYASVAIVHVAFNENVLPRELRGFGFLVPSSESKRADLTPEAKLALDGLLGVTFDSVTFPQQNFSREEYERLTNPDMSSMANRSVATEQSAEQKLGVDRLSAQLRLTVMMGGARSPHIATLAAADWEARARAVVKHLLRIDAEPDLVRAHCARQGIPQPNVGHIARLNRVHGALNELTHGRVELGGMVNGVSVPDCVMNACRAATSFALQSLPTVDKAQAKTAL